MPLQGALCCSMPPKRAASKGVKKATKRPKSSASTTPPPLGQLSMEAEERIVERIPSRVATVVQDMLRATVAHPGVAVVQVPTTTPTMS
jgi:hypothetical protein